MSIVLRPVQAVLAAQIAAAVVLDSTDRTARTAGRPDGSVRVGETTFAAVIQAMVARARRESAAAAGV